MYREFQEHGSAAFIPDASGAMLTEAGLVGATSPAANGSSVSGAHAEGVGIRGDQLQMPQQPHAEQEGADLEGTSDSSTVLHLAEAAAEASSAGVSLDPDGRSGAEQRWPHDIQWLPVNPLVSSHSCVFCLATSCC